jgi:hypothetical protein
MFGSWSLLGIFELAALACEVYALVEAAIHSAGAFRAAGKLTKQAWVAILAVAVAVGLLGDLFGALGLAAVVATIVYFVDVRPALRRVSGRSM